MIMHGHFENGVVVLDEGTPLPDGTTVTIAESKPAVSPSPPSFPPVPFPLIRTGIPGSLKLTNAMINQILADEDVPARY